MKKICVAITALLFFLTHQGMFAQTASIRVTDTRNPAGLAVSCYKTTNLIFPYAIKSVDKGSRDILVQKAGGVENVLQVKAGKERFPQTNLTVITADGQLYSFVVDYAIQPQQLNVRLENNRPDKGLVQFSLAEDNEAQVKGIAETISAKNPLLSGIKAKNNDARMQLRGLYVKDDLFYFQLELENRSDIGYDVDQLRFFIRDLEIARRTAHQELELKPRQVLGNARVIHGHSKQTVVVAIPKFTIQDKKELQIQLTELRGARNLTLQLKNGQLVHAVSI
ncbi:Bacteroides conjugative transposon TraN protein [Mucilaginibacter pineti]|uniref:Bacteroides conjugative transposon TraN protein n=1 Tax=Mucilaginibacter pineti TaxID=1391627 RepID=A0A1G7IP86_9SPHI|nr:conjugative transposon protein TraN [Mucilaginibacter pineti]SDF14425.1 Bacteroides conjugative transposon TraN protein [Mucilaginibacter pineti]